MLAAVSALVREDFDQVMSSESSFTYIQAEVQE